MLGVVGKHIKQHIGIDSRNHRGPRMSTIHSSVGQSSFRQPRTFLHGNDQNCSFQAESGCGGRSAIGGYRFASRNRSYNGGGDTDSLRAIGPTTGTTAHCAVL